MKKIALCLSVLFCFVIFGCNPVVELKQTTYSPSDVALLNIFSYDGGSESVFGIKNLGHSFLSIVNTSDADIVLAGKTISPHEEVYFGAWSLSVHFGIWYNVESNYIEFYNKYNGRGSIEKGITEEDLEVISDYILNHDRWTPLSNCSKFAIGCWNRVAKENEKLNMPIINTPKKLMNQLKNFSNFQTNKPLNIYTNCGYFSNLTTETFVFEGGEVYV